MYFKNIFFYFYLSRNCFPFNILFFLIVHSSGQLCFKCALDITFWFYSKKQL